MTLDLTPKLTSVSDVQRAQSDGTYKKFKLITYKIGQFGLFTDDIPDSPNWNTEAQQKMQAQANALRSLGV